jgi:tetratricopeptide (TPR) repeat protein
MDLIDSTKAGLEFITAKLDHFNISLVEQIRPHLIKLGLDDAMLKFTGDGWLLMTHEADKVPALCCMAIIMAKRFQLEMSQITGVDIKNVPSLRLAICSGRDIRVELPDGHMDWVGDSVRRAVRSSKCCVPNEILIDEPVRYHVLRDFKIKPADIKQSRNKNNSLKMEEDFTLYVLGELNPDVAAESIAPEYYVYTLGTIGKVKEAGMAAKQVAKRLSSDAIKLKITERRALHRNWRRWHQLIASVPDYSSALMVLESIRDSGLTPDIVTYNMLVNKAPNYKTARELVNTMSEEKVKLKVAIYNALMEKSPDYNTAMDCFKNMSLEGIKPNTATHNVLIEKSPDYNTAMDCFKNMSSVSIKANAVTYNAIMEKSPDYETAIGWLDTMRAAEVKPNVVTYTILVKKAPTYNKAKSLVYKMRLEKIKPDLITYTTLVSKASTYSQAKSWIDKMHGAGMQPSVVAYSALFSRDLSKIPAEEILGWYLVQTYHPEEPIRAAINSYRKVGRIDQALRLILDYPHLAEARKTISEYQDEALKYFKTLYDNDPDHPNTSYALGAALMEIGQGQDAIPYLKKAMKLARPGIRKSEIKKWLKQIEGGVSQE